ncbi:MAG: hypothetical protein K5852_03050 [Eubacterium sp.]|nr:hypothetical protein [Eubacterium sp.]
MAENNENNTFQENVEALFRGMDAFLSTKAVVGEAVPVGDSLMIPLADVSFGLGAGALSATNKNNGGGGMGAKVSPAAVLLIAKDGTTKLVSLKGQDAVSKIIDMAPDILTKIANHAKTPSEPEKEK